MKTQEEEEEAKGIQILLRLAGWLVSCIKRGTDFTFHHALNAGI